MKTEEKLNIEVPENIKSINEFLAWVFMNKRNDTIQLSDAVSLVHEYSQTLPVVPSPKGLSAEEVLKKSFLDQYNHWANHPADDSTIEQVFDRWFLKAMEEYKSLSQSQEGWVSVEERLPEAYGEQYIAQLHYEDGPEVITVVFEEFNEWHNLEDKSTRFYNVTHWRPLPKPL